MIATLSDLIALVESNNNPFAMRYEPAFLPQPQAVNSLASKTHCSLSTAQIILKTSWGKFQIMGQSLYDLGFVDWPGVMLANGGLQTQLFGEYCTRRGINFTLDEIINSSNKRALFAKYYNGPGNIPVYSQRIIDTYQAHK